MNISFKRQNNELILVYSPEYMETKVIQDALDGNKSWTILRCFTVDRDHFRHENKNENEIHFCIGIVQSEYTKLDRDVLGTTYDFYFSNDITLHKRHFLAYRNISILRKIDKVANQDVYIGGNCKEGFLPIETFEQLIQKFPKTAELDHYAYARIATIIKEYYPIAERHEENFRKYIERQDKILSSTISHTQQTFWRDNLVIEFNQFNDIHYTLYELLSRADSISEQIWQEKVYALLRLIYPKYIAGIREVVIKGVDHHDKRPDFILVDANGYIDILEIKKPTVQLLTKQSSYRNNYVPVRELAGAIQQIEKYIHCLNVWGKEGESRFQKQFADKLPATVTPKVVNPQGILLLGRSNQFNRQQKVVGQAAPVYVVRPLAQEVEHLGERQRHNEIVGGVRVADDEERRRPLVPQAVQLHFVVAHDLPELGNVKGSQPRPAANKYGAGSLAAG